MRQAVLNFLFFSMQLKHADNTFSNNEETFLNPTDILIQPNKQTVIFIKSQVYTENEVTGILQASRDLEDNDDYIICPALTTTEKKQFTLLNNIFMDHPYTLKKGYHLATFSIFTAERSKYIKPVNPAQLCHLLETNQDDAIQYANASQKTPKSEECTEINGYPTPHEPGDVTQHEKRSAYLKN